MARWKASAPLGAILLWMTVAARGQELCPAFKVIEELPFTDQGKISCEMASAVGRYDSSKCRIPGFDYSGGEAVYKVRLNEGNEVSFSLDVQGTADLVLALVEACGDGRTCVSSSTDFIGPGDEEISAAKYQPGIYYLYVDSVAGACGTYELTVKGINPTPDLVLELSAPQRAIAGTSMTYVLKITNRGKLAATGVEITQTLPEGVTWQSGSGCTGNGRNVVCPVGELQPEAEVRREVKVLVSPGTRGLRTSTVEAKAANQETAPPARDEATTRVDGQIDLSIRMASADAVVAGEQLTYIFTLRNAGPSDATQVKVIDIPSGKEVFSEASSVWACEPVTEDGIAKVICEIPGIPAGGTVTSSIEMAVRSSAVEPLVNRATITAAENEPACRRNRSCGPNSAFIETRVERVTDLGIDKDGPEQPVPVGSVFSYTLTVENRGPSDSTGAVVTDCLPNDLHLEGNSCQRVDQACKTVDDAEGYLVTCAIGLLPFGHRKGVSLEVRTAADRPLSPISNKAIVKAKEEDPDTINDESNEIKTRFKIEADLRLLSKTAKRVDKPGIAESVCAGENILYTIEAVNSGPSNSSGGTIDDTLPEGLTFVSSPDRCTAADDLRTVTCPVPPLAVNAPPYTARIVAVPTGTVAGVINKASVTGKDDDPSPKSESEPVSTTVAPDLAVSLTASKDLVMTGESVIYTVGAVHGGPSEAEDVKVILDLPEPAPASPLPDCSAPPDCNAADCILSLGDVPSGGAGTAADICVQAPSNRGSFLIGASLVKADLCGRTDNDKAKITTTVAEAGDVDLAVTMTADAQAVAVGDLLTYTIKVVNQGPAASPKMTITDELPEGTSPEPVPPGCVSSATMLSCPDLTAPAEVEVKVRVLSGAQTPLENRATVAFAPGAAPIDPDPDDNAATIETPVLPGPLLLPFFEVDGRLEEITTILAVRNLTSGSVDVQYDFLDDPVSLAPHATDTVNLRDETGFARKTGYVAISPGPPSLGGDFVRIDPSAGTASGGRLVAATEMCREWSVRFFKGEPLETSTEFLFFAPGNGAGEPVATGRVFNEKGQFVQDIAIPNTEESFRIKTRDLPLLAGSGSIEWTLRDGLVGHVAAVHREKDKDEVAVPGFCRQPEPAGTPALILPFFKIDPHTTLFATRNETEGPIQAKVSYFSGEGMPAGDSSSFSLAGHETRTVGLREQPLDEVTEGYAQVDLDPPADVSGDFLLIDPLGSRAGGALVRSPQLCRCWDVRFVQDTPSGSKTDLLFYVQGHGTARGTVYGQGGEEQKTVPIPLRASFLLPVSELPPAGLGLTGSGAIAWDLGETAVGYVAALFTEAGAGDGYSVLVPGLCLASCP